MWLLEPHAPPSTPERTLSRARTGAPPSTTLVVHSSSGFQNIAAANQQSRILTPFGKIPWYAPTFFPVTRLKIGTKVNYAPAGFIGEFPGLPKHYHPWHLIPHWHKSRSRSGSTEEQESSHTSLKTCDKCTPFFQYRDLPQFSALFCSCLLESKRAEMLAACLAKYGR